MHRLIFLVLLGFVTIPFRCQDTQYDDDKNKDYCMNATAPASMLDIPDSGWVKELLKVGLMRVVIRRAVEIWRSLISARYTLSHVSDNYHARIVPF